MSQVGQSYMTNSIQNIDDCVAGGPLPFFCCLVYVDLILRLRLVWNCRGRGESFWRGGRRSHSQLGLGGGDIVIDRGVGAALLWPDDNPVAPGVLCLFFLTRGSTEDLQKYNIKVLKEIKISLKYTKNYTCSFIYFPPQVKFTQI